jgi:Protein of unknown function (DUF4238)
VNRPKKQHWVPQFYLRHFATSASRGKKVEAQVWVFSKDEADGDESLKSVRNVCAEGYLYSPVSKSGERVWDLENELGRLETTLGGLWPTLAGDYMDLSDPTLRKAVSLFVAVMHLRHPHTLEAVKQIHRSLVGFYEEMSTRPDGTPDVDSVEVSGTIYPLDTSGWHAYRAWGRNDHHRFFTHVIQSEALRLADLLMQKRWSMIISERDTFVTTDKPVSTQHQTETAFGFRTPGVIVSFPVSPRRLLVMDDMHHEPANQYYALQASAVGASNYSIWQNASRFMITGRPIPEVLAELVEWAHSHAKRDA